jgi:hypothetical protein
VVVAPTMADAVRSAGGWLFDRVMTGWDVVVLLGEPSDPRPSLILGARSAPLEAAFTPSVSGPRPHVLAVDARLYDADKRIRHWVHRSIDEGLTEVRLWGEHLSPELDSRTGSVRHRLSVAARAFKAQALAAAAAPVGSIADSELFRSGELLPDPPYAPDLIPA